MAALLSDLDLLARLVGFDSTSRESNLPIADFLCDYLDRPGVRVHRHPSPDGDKVNLLIWAGPEPEEAGGPGLVLSGHMDVVPAEEPEWTGDPFTLRRGAKDGREVVFGRGSADMKGFVALAVHQMARIDPQRLAHPLVLVLTRDEELGTLGARHLAESWPELSRRMPPLPKSAIIGEPTSLRVVRMHKGHMKMRVTLTGTSAHSGYPHLGVNAIEPAGAVILALAALARELEAEAPPHREHFPEVPYVALNLAQIHGGVAVNVVPERCVLDLGARVLPDMDAAETAERARAAAMAAARAAGAGERCRFEVLGESPPMLLAEDAPICRHLYGLMGQSETASASYATDAGWLSRLGLDCAIWGPGTIEVAHRPDEYLPLDEFHRAAELLEHTVDRFCMEDG